MGPLALWYGYDVVSNGATIATTTCHFVLHPLRHLVCEGIVEGKEKVIGATLGQLTHDFPHVLFQLRLCIKGGVIAEGRQLVQEGAVSRCIGNVDQHTCHGLPIELIDTFEGPHHIFGTVPSPLRLNRIKGVLDDFRTEGKIDDGAFIVVFTVADQCETDPVHILV